MHLSDLAAINLRRCIVGFKHPLEEWSVAEWTNAMAGEAGEAANIGKKIIRLRSAVNMMNKISDTPDDLKRKLMQELSDTVIYADLCAQRVGASLEEYVIKTFNDKSKEMGLTDPLFYL